MGANKGIMRLRTWRAENGKSQADIAPLIGCPNHKQVSLIESGKAWPNPVQISLILEMTSDIPGRPLVTLEDLLQTWHAANPDALDKARAAAQPAEVG